MITEIKEFPLYWNF